MKKYKTIEDADMGGDRLRFNIGVAITESRRDQWVDLKEFFRAHNINIAENLRQCVYRELDSLEEVRSRKLKELSKKRVI